MTIIIDEIWSEESSRAETGTVLCSWCGESIDLEDSVSADAMCQSCHIRMLDEFQRAQQQLSSPHASDR